MFQIRTDFRINPEHKKALKQLKTELSGLIINAVSDPLPEQNNRKIGVLFSGGIDSTLIAFILRELGVDFTCYTSALDIADTNFSEAEDVVWAKQIAEQLDFKIKIRRINLKQTERNLKKLMKIIPNPDVVKAGVGLTFFTALEEAKKDNVKTVFSGLGSEEIFAGYQRHAQASNINEECIEGLKSLHDRDLSRDEAILDYFGMKLALPFLNHELMSYSLRIPGKYKITKDNNKVIMRQVAENLGIPKEFANRKKRAAQYGSKFDKALRKLAIRNGFGTKKREYVMSLPR